MQKVGKHTLSAVILARALWAGIILLALLVLGGCATAPKPVPFPGPGAVAPGPGSGWWSVYLHFSWPADAPPAMHLDLLTAREILAPLIEAHRGELALWRFHRRAARDRAGHRLGFLFYTPAETARQINTALMADPLLAELHAAGLMERVVLDDPEETPPTDPAATSDPNWSPALQASWPYFIMGASQLWLDLMEQFAARQSLGPPPEDLAGLIQHYQGLEERMTATWQQEGRHALLHHLNALFGYQRLAIMMRF
jgi:hypothetical protein